MSKKDTDRILKNLEKSWEKVSIPKVKNVKIFEIEDNKSILVIDSTVAVFTADESILPFLGKTEILDKFPSVTVDSGSIRFICNGAKILRPGIVNQQNWNCSASCYRQEDKPSCCHFSRKHVILKLDWLYKDKVRQ